MVDEATILGATGGDWVWVVPDLVTYEALAPTLWDAGWMPVRRYVWRSSDARVFVFVRGLIAGFPEHIPTRLAGWTGPAAPWMARELDRRTVPQP